MALSPSEKIFITKLKDAGYTEAQSVDALKKQRQKKTGSFAGRLNLATQDISPDVAVKGEAVTQATEDLNAAPDKNSVMDVVTGKKNIYGDDLTEAKKNAPSVTGTLVGAAKGVASAVSGASSLGEKAINTVLPDSLNSDAGTLFTEGKGQTAGEMAKESDLLQANTTSEKVGKFLGENVLPAMAGGIAGTSAKVLGGGSKIAQGLLGFLGSSAGGTAGYTVGAKGDLPTAKELATGAVIDAVTLGAFKAFPKLAGGTKNVFSKFYNTVKNKGASEMTIETLDQLKKSGVDAQSIMESLVKQEEAYVKDQISNPSVLSTVGKNIFKDYVGELVPAKQSVGKDIADAVAAVDDYFPGRGIVGLTTDGTLDSLKTGLKDIGIEATEKGLDFSKSSIKFNEANQNTLKKVYNSLLGYVDNKFAIPPSEKWAIAQSLDDLTEYNAKLASQTTSSVELPLVQLKKNLMNDVKAALEEGGENVGLFKQYADLSTAVELLNKRFGEGGEGGFSILKALKGEQKFGEEARKALGIMKKITGVDYFQQVKMALAAADIAGNEQVKSLLSTTSGKGAIMDVIKEGFLDKKLLLKQLSEESPDIAKEVLEKAISAIAKSLGLELVGGE